jgi:AraC-like DNA-binding protein
MDALSEILRVIRLESAIYLNGEFYEPWRIATPESRKLAHVFSDRAGHVIIYHLLCEGTATVHLHDGTEVVLVAGDLITFPHGDRHTLGGGNCVTAVCAEDVLPDVMKKKLELLRVGGAGGRSRFICGFLICDPQLSEGFLGGLPPFIRTSIRDDESGQWLENTLKFSVAQAANREAGANAMVAKLSEVLFAETLRRYGRDLPDGQTGWLAGARDPEVGKALTLVHNRPAHPWTVAELAREVGLSRTVLSERFRHFLGEPPMTYLTRWRLRLGARALTGTSHSVAQVAFDTGYESEAAFNRAFKREYGLPPARYRKTSHTAAASRQQPTGLAVSAEPAASRG